METLVNEKSTHQYPVFDFDYSQSLPHFNADNLRLYKIPGGEYVYVLNINDWKDYVGKVCYVCPDSLVDTKLPQFSFLEKDGKYDEDSATGCGGTFARIKSKKIRGIISYGLLVKTTEGEDLNIKRYDPDINVVQKPKDKLLTGGEAEKAPEGVYPVYDVDAYMKYGKLIFNKGEHVTLSEKVHGSSGRFVFTDKMNCGSRGEWKKEFSVKPNITLEQIIEHFEGDVERATKTYEKYVVNFKSKKILWWEVLERTPELRHYCENNPYFTVYGEIYGGGIQKGYSYGLSKPGFIVFDILDSSGKWLDTEDFWETCDKWKLPRVHVLEKCVPFDFEKMLVYAEGKTTFDASHIREGCVIRPLKERWDDRVGRVCFKIINPEY